MRRRVWRGNYLRKQFQQMECVTWITRETRPRYVQREVAKLSQLGAEYQWRHQINVSDKHLIWKFQW